jgi:hypothetical protein
VAQAALVDVKESFRSGRTEIVAGLRSTQAPSGAVHLEQLRWAARCDNAEVWREDGARSTGEWLARELGISQWKAHRMIASGHALTSLPYISACLGNGSLSLDKTLELTRFATPETERELVRWARRVTPGGYATGPTSSSPRSSKRSRRSSRLARCRGCTRSMARPCVSMRTFRPISVRW